MDKKLFIVKHFIKKEEQNYQLIIAKYNESLLSNKSIIIAFNKASKKNKKVF